MRIWNFRPPTIFLYIIVSSFGNFNFNGARIPLTHTKIKINKFRELLPKHFNDLGLLQYLEFGFPLGLVEDHILHPSHQNHSSSYDFYTHIDKFVMNEICEGGLSGPLNSVPFDQFMIFSVMQFTRS